MEGFAEGADAAGPPCLKRNCRHIKDLECMDAPGEARGRDTGVAGCGRLKKLQKKRQAVEWQSKGQRVHLHKVFHRLVSKYLTGRDFFPILRCLSGKHLP